MNRLPGITHALLRIVAGLLLFQPGAMKLFGWYGGLPPGVPLEGMTLAGGIIEVIAGALVMVGLFTRPAAFIAAGEMAVAYWKYHFKPAAFWPTENHGEAAVLLAPAPKPA